MASVTPVTDPKVLSQLNAGAGASPVTDPAVLAQLNASTQQPSALDRAVASPVGRFVHDAIAAPIAGLADLALPLGWTGQEVRKGINAVGDAYQGALARNRNTPGYAAALDVAQQMQHAHPSGIGDQLTAPFNPSLAGLAGLPGGFDAMNANADAQAAGQTQYAAQHPILSLGAGLIGGFATGAPEGVAANLPQQIGTLTRPIAAPISPLAGKPEEAAVAYIQGLGADPAKLSAAQAAAGSKPITTAEAIGKPGEVALGALGRRDGGTPDALTGLVRARSADAPQRILSDYATASGIDPNAARGDIQAFIDAQQAAASPLYEQAYKANQNIASPMLDRILATPAGKKALADARTKMQNDMSLMGTPDADLMNQAAEGGTQIPSNGVASGMKLRVYDYVKRSLDDQISAAYKAGNKNEGNIIKDLKGKLVTALDKADVTAAAGPNSVKPEGGLYAQARAKAGEYLSAQKQFEAGQADILDGNLPARDFAANFAKMGAADQQAYLGGVANKLFNLQQQGKMRADIFKAPLIQSKLATVMGPQKAAEFLGNMSTEQQMANFARTRVPGAGSPTAEYQQAMKDQDGNAALALDAIQLVGDAGKQGLLPAIGNLAVKKAKDAAATYVTRGMAIPVRDAAGRLLMQPPADTAAFLSGLPKIPPKAALQLPALTPASTLPYGLLPRVPLMLPSAPSGQ